MRKLLSVMLLAVAIFFISGQNNFAEAKDVYVAREYGGSRDIYVVTESIDKSEVNTVRVTVKYVKNGKLLESEHRVYVNVDGQWWLNSEESLKEGLRATRVWNVYEDEVLMYCLNW